MCPFKESLVDGSYVGHTSVSVTRRSDMYVRIHQSQRFFETFGQALGSAVAALASQGVQGDRTPGFGDRWERRGSLRSTDVGRDRCDLQKMLRDIVVKAQ